MSIYTRPLTNFTISLILLSSEGEEVNKSTLYSSLQTLRGKYGLLPKTARLLDRIFLVFTGKGFNSMVLNLYAPTTSTFTHVFRDSIRVSLHSSPLSYPFANIMTRQLKNHVTSVRRPYQFIDISWYYWRDTKGTKKWDIWAKSCVWPVSLR